MYNKLSSHKESPLNNNVNITPLSEKQSFENNIDNNDDITPLSDKPSFKNEIPVQIPFLSSTTTTEDKLPIIYNDRLLPISNSKDTPIKTLTEEDEYSNIHDYNYIKERLGQYDKPCIQENVMQPNPHQVLEEKNPFQQHQSLKSNKPEQIQFQIPIK
jgi:hypothetical protein